MTPQQPASAGRNALAPKTYGAYIDGAGKRHPWQVADNRTLVWEGKPYLPVGGRFQVRSWSAEADVTTAQAEDVLLLRRLKASGISEALLEPVGTPISRVAPSRIQAIVDAAETEGLTYGIALGDGPSAPLLGYQVQPSRFRQPAGTSGFVHFTVRDPVSALYCLALPDGEVLDVGEGAVIEGGARVPVRSELERAVVVLYPEKVFRGADGLPNVWDDFDAYRDRVLEALGHVRFGPGLRFFVDPLPATLSLDGLNRTVVPSGSGATREWGVYLSRRYRTVGELSNAWRVTRLDAIRDFAVAARLLPLWFDGKGLPALLDRETRDRIPVEDFRSGFWADLDAFKAESYRGYAGQLAASLKRGVADVPVLVRTRGFTPMLAGLTARDIFDGLAVEASPGSLATAAEAAAQATDAARPIWIAAFGVREDRRVVPAGFASESALTATLDGLRSLGARGYFVDGVRLVDPDRMADDLSRLPDQLGWLSGYARRLESNNTAAAPGIEQGAVFYPRVMGLPPVRLASGAWWLPTDRSHSAYDFGNCGRGYGITETGGNAFYLWHSTESRQVRVRIPKALKDARIAWSPANRGSRNKDMLTLQVGPEPVRVTGFGSSIPLPGEAFEEALATARALAAELRRRDHPNARLIPMELDRFRSGYNPESPQQGYSQLQAVLEQIAKMQSLLQPYAYVWLEGELLSPRISHYFDLTEPWSGASGGRVLSYFGRSEGSLAPSASFTLAVNKNRTYRLFVAGSVDARFIVRLDGQLLGGDETVAPKMVGASYGVRAGLVWYDCGSVTLAPGDRTLTVLPSGPFSLDALLLTSDAFVPNGPHPPSLLPPASPK